MICPRLSERLSALFIAVYGSVSESLFWMMSKRIVELYSSGNASDPAAPSMAETIAKRTTFFQPARRLSTYCDSFISSGYLAARWPNVITGGNITDLTRFVNGGLAKTATLLPQLHVQVQLQLVSDESDLNDGIRIICRERLAERAAFSD